MKRGNHVGAAAAALVLAGAAFATAGVSSANAADLAAPLMAPPPVSDPMLEWGSGWYLRGDLGVTDQQNNPSMNLPGAFSKSSKTKTGWSAEFGVGYQINEVFRTDVTAGLRRPTERTNYNTYTCQVDATTTDTCTARGRVRTTRYPILANMYLDLGNFGGFKPYVGAGIGVAVVDTYFNRHDARSNGATYSANYTDPSTGAAIVINNEADIRKRRTNMAYALMAGVGYEISDGFTLDIGYRYLDMGRVSIPGTNTRNRLIEQEARVGVRYKFD